MLPCIGYAFHLKAKFRDKSVEFPEDFAKAQAASMPSLAVASVLQQQFSDSGGKAIRRDEGLSAIGFPKISRKPSSMWCEFCSLGTRSISYERELADSQLFFNLCL